MHIQLVNLTCSTTVLRKLAIEGLKPGVLRTCKPQRLQKTQEGNKKHRAYLIEAHEHVFLTRATPLHPINAGAANGRILAIVCEIYVEPPTEI